MFVFTLVDVLVVVVTVVVTVALVVVVIVNDVRVSKGSIVVKTHSLAFHPVNLCLKTARHVYRVNCHDVNTLNIRPSFRLRNCT